MAGFTIDGNQCLTSPQQEFNPQQLFHDAQTRWLKPAEVCEILNNHNKFKLFEASPIKPPSGSLFLFDRTKLRYFRKDGHNWRKKKDGKTIREAHEKLKAGNKDVIHCYYAHGEDNPNFQRRSYWLLEGGYEHIVLVHYREVTEGNRLESFQQTFEGSQSQYFSQMQSKSMIYGNISDYFPPSLTSSPSEMLSPCFNSHEDEVDSGDEFGDSQMTRSGQSQASTESVLQKLSTDLGLDSTDTLQYAAPLLAPTVDNMAPARKTMPYSCSNLEMHGVTQLQHGVQIQTAASQYPYEQHFHEDDLEESLETASWSTLLDTLQTVCKNHELAADIFNGNSTPRETGEYMGQSASSMDASPFSSRETAYEANLQVVREQNCCTKASIKVEHHVESNALLTENSHLLQPAKQDLQSSQHNKPDETQHSSKSPNPYTIDQEKHNINYELLSPNISYLMQSIQFDAAMGNETLPDDFTWIDGSPILSIGISSRPETSWGDVIKDQSAGFESSSLLGKIHYSAGPDPLLSQKQCFSIVDFAPEWSYSFEETKVIVTGNFLDPTKSSSNIQWCCMFGEIEVPAEVLQSGALRCIAPAHEPGRVSFYVTCSDRVSCSEIREFEYRSRTSSFSSKLETDKQEHQEQEMLHKVRLAELLFTGEDEACPQEVFSDPEAAQKQSDRSNSLMVDQNIWSQIEGLVKSNKHPFEDAKAMLVQTLLKSKLQQWLHRKSHLKGVSFLNKHGLGVLHMTAALGYEWAIAPILAAGVVINFRDAHGWTALHWAAFCGREKVVGLLLAADAAAGALTDPTPSDPTGRTAADLAASSGHDGIAAYLAEASLTSHLSSLNLNETVMNKVSAAVAGDKAVEVVSEKSSVNASLGTTEDQLSLKDSLAAVRNAAQAAARIQAAFRAYSFRQRGDMKDSSINGFGMLEEEARAFAAAQTIQRAFGGHHEKLINLAATQIQCKYRGWKGRKDFLSLKKQVVKIQAHVRGHQVRKVYTKLLWSVGVLDKAILRWRRKGQGLRGFKAEEVEDGDSNDDAFLKDFRRQKEEAFDDALSRVKLMIQAPEARNQYRRMLEIYQKEKGAQCPEDLVILPDDELMGL